MFLNSLCGGCVAASSLSLTLGEPDEAAPSIGAFQGGWTRFNRNLATVSQTEEEKPVWWLRLLLLCQPVVVLAPEPSAVVEVSTPSNLPACEECSSGSKSNTDPYRWSGSLSFPSPPHSVSLSLFPFLFSSLLLLPLRLRPFPPWLRLPADKSSCSLLSSSWSSSAAISQLRLTPRQLAVSDAAAPSSFSLPQHLHTSFHSILMVSVSGSRSETMFECLRFFLAICVSACCFIAFGEKSESRGGKFLVLQGKFCGCEQFSIFYF